MAKQRKEKQLEELTPDQCIDFAAGLLDRKQREDVLLRAGQSPESEELLRSVMAQAETARAAGPRRQAEAREAARPAFDLGGRLERLLSAVFGSGRLVPAMAGATLLVLGLITGAGTMHLFGPDEVGSGSPARLISLFPSATRTVGPAAAVTPGTGLYIELNDLDDFPCDTILRFDLLAPSGASTLQGRLTCHPETGEWAGLFLPAQLLTAPGTYSLQLQPEGVSPEGAEPAVFSFSIDPVS